MTVWSLPLREGSSELCVLAHARASPRDAKGILAAIDARGEQYAKDLVVAPLGREKRRLLAVCFAQFLFRHPVEHELRHAHGAVRAGVEKKFHRGTALLHPDGAASCMGPELGPRFDECVGCAEIPAARGVQQRLLHF